MVIMFVCDILIVLLFFLLFLMVAFDFDFDSTSACSLFKPIPRKKLTLVGFFLKCIVSNKGLFNKYRIMDNKRSLFYKLNTKKKHSKIDSFNRF